MILRYISFLLLYSDRSQHVYHQLVVLATKMLEGVAVTTGDIRLHKEKGKKDVISASYEAMLS